MKLKLESVADLLKKNHHFVITAHLNPDGDAVGSVLGLAHLLTGMGKKVTCLIDDDIPDNFQIMPGCETINKPLQPIDNVDLLIILDSSDLERIGKVKDVVNAPILNIDHHISNNEFADYLYLDHKKAATGEIIFELLKQMNITLTQEIAICLYVAIATDCGFFRYANTSENTMNIGAELIHAGVKPNLVSEELEKKPLQSLKTLAKVLQSLELFADGKIGCITINEELLACCDSTEGFIDFARTVEGVDVAVMVKYVDHATCRISMRSKTVDVSKIALNFNGGGHVRAAGCTLNYSLDEAKKIILQTIKDVIGA